MTKPLLAQGCPGRAAGGWEAPESPSSRSPGCYPPPGAATPAEDPSLAVFSTSRRRSQGSARRRSPPRGGARRHPRRGRGEEPPGKAKIGRRGCGLGGKESPPRGAAPALSLSCADEQPLLPESRRQRNSVRGPPSCAPPGSGEEGTGSPAGSGGRKDGPGEGEGRLIRGRTVAAR